MCANASWRAKNVFEVCFQLFSSNKISTSAQFRDDKKILNTCSEMK